MRKCSDNRPLWLQRIKQSLSLLITFYISYLFLHFIILEITPIESTLVIVAIIWVGHILLNTVTIGMRKKQTFGDLLFRIQYILLKENNSADLNKQLLIHSFLTTNTLYMLIYLKVEFKFSMGILLGSLCFGIFLLAALFKRKSFQGLNLFDWASGTKIF